MIELKRYVLGCPAVVCCGGGWEANIYSKHIRKDLALLRPLAVKPPALKDKANEGYADGQPMKSSPL